MIVIISSCPISHRFLNFGHFAKTSICFQKWESTNIIIIRPNLTIHSVISNLQVTSRHVSFIWLIIGHDTPYFVGKRSESSLHRRHFRLPDFQGDVGIGYSHFIVLLLTVAAYVGVHVVTSHVPHIQSTSSSINYATAHHRSPVYL